MRHVAGYNRVILLSKALLTMASRLKHTIPLASYRRHEYLQEIKTVSSLKASEDVREGILESLASTKERGPGAV